MNKWPMQKKKRKKVYWLLAFYGISTPSWLFNVKFSLCICVCMCVGFINKYFVGNIIFKRARAHLFAQLNDFKYSYLTVSVLFKINHLFAHS